MIVMAQGLCLGVLLLCSVGVLSVNFTDASAAYSFASTQSGSHTSSYGPRKYHHPHSYTTHPSGLGSIHLESDLSGSSRSIPKRGTVYNVGNHGRRRLISTVHEGGSNCKYVPSIVSPLAIQMRCLHIGSAPSVALPDLRSTLVVSHGQRETPYGQFGSEDGGPNPKIFPKSIVPSSRNFLSTRSGISHNADNERHSGNANRQPGGSTSDSNRYYHSDLAPKAISPPTILFGSAHRRNGHSADNQGHSGNAYSYEGNRYDHNNLAPSAISPLTIAVGSDYSGTSHSSDNRGHSGNTYNQPRSRHSTSEENRYDHSRLAPSVVNPPTIHFGSANSGTGHDADNQGHSGNANSQPGNGESMGEGNRYAHNDLAPSAISPPTILFGSAHSGTGHSVDNRGHGGNAYSQPGSGHSTREGNRYDHDSHAPSAVNPPTIRFGSAYSGTGHGANHLGHGENANSQPGYGEGTREGNHYDHDNLAPSAINPPTIYFGMEYSGTGHGTDNRGPSGNAYSQPGYGHSPSEGERYDHHNHAPHIINPPPILFGSAYSGTGHGANHLGHGGNAYSQPGYGEGTREGNRYDHNSFGPSATNPPAIHFGSAYSSTGHGADNRGHSGNAYSQPGYGEGTREGNRYDHNSLAPSAINPPTIYFGSEYSGAGHVADNRGHSGNAYSQPGYGHSPSEGDRYDHHNHAPHIINPPPILFGSAYSGTGHGTNHLGHGGNANSREGNRYDHNSFGPSATNPPAIHFGSAYSGTGHGANHLGHGGNANSREGNRYDHNSFGPSATNPPAIHFGSAYSSTGHGADNHGHSGNAYSQPGYGEGTREGNRYDHNRLAPSAIHPPTIYFGSEYSGAGHVADNRGHSGNAYSQPGYGHSPSEGDRYDHHNHAPHIINPPPILFGSAYSGTGHGTNHLGHGGNANSREGNRYDHNSFGPSATNPPAIHFGSAYSSTGHGADNHGHSGNAYSQPGNGESMGEGNRYDHNSFGPSATNPPAIHFGSANSATGHSVGNQGHHGNEYRRYGSGGSTGEGNYYARNNLGSSAPASNIPSSSRIYEVISLVPLRTFFPNTLNSEYYTIHPRSRYGSIIFPRRGKPLHRQFQSALQREVVLNNSPHPQNSSPSQFLSGKFVHHIHGMKSHSNRQRKVLSTISASVSKSSSN